MKSRVHLFLLVPVFLLLTTGCVFLRGAVWQLLDPERPATGIPDETVQEVDEAAGAPSGPTVVEVINNSDYPVCYIYSTASENDYWGNNILADDAKVEPGITYSLELPAGQHDLLLQTCDDETLATAWELTQPTTITIGGDGLIPMVIDNQTKTEICYLYFAQIGSDTWEDDQLGLWETIPPFGAKRIVFLEAGVYDAVVSDCDDQDITWREDVEISEPYVWVVDVNEGLPDHRSVYDGSDLQITVDNYADSEFCYVYISPSDANEWGRDWLKHDQTIKSGFSEKFSLVAGEYDVAVRDCSNAVVESVWGITEDYRLQVGGDGLVALRVINWHENDICFVYIEDESSDSIGENWLPGWEIIPGYSGKRVFFVEPGTYHVTAEDCDGRMLAEESGLGVLEETPWIVGLED